MNANQIPFSDPAELDLLTVNVFIVSLTDNLSAFVPSLGKEFFAIFALVCGYGKKRILLGLGASLASPAWRVLPLLTLSLVPAVWTLMRKNHCRAGTAAVMSAASGSMKP
jgi:hypothetical protein